MWDNLLRVSWSKLTHAYGRARDVPDILRGMIAADEKSRSSGWDGFWGSLNHQGDFYDSTVATIPFLVEAVGHPEVHGRANILNALRDRWLDAPKYGGDPLVSEPPGGIDEPTPMLTDAEFAALPPRAFQTDVREDPVAAAEEDPDFDVNTRRRMDLCAWQTARAIQAGQPTFERLLKDPDRQVATAAAFLLLLWPGTRASAKRALVRMIVEENDPARQAGCILEFGVYATADDLPTFAEWVVPGLPLERRAVAALAWAWAINPAPLPKLAATALATASAPTCLAFANLPKVGVYRQGTWSLPANAADLILRLTASQDKELRWRAVQGCALEYPTAKHLVPEQLIPLLIRRLSDDYNRIRDAAALALSQRGERVLDIDPDAVPKILAALEPHESAVWGEHEALDCDASPCGHAAHLLTLLSHRLNPAQRRQALAAIERAGRRYAGRENQYVRFHSMWTPGANFLNEIRGVFLKRSKPAAITLAELFREFAFPKKTVKLFSSRECDRRLADAYARAPRKVIAAAVQAIAGAGKADGRVAACGAADWLLTLGPAAEPALDALDAMARADLAPGDQFRAKGASESIRRAILVNQHKPFALGPSAALGDLVALLAHAEADVRATAAERLASLTADVARARQAIPALEKLLADEASVMVGVWGEVECEGRLYHWLQERRSPRAAAIRALFALAYVLNDQRMITAMCGDKAIPCRFTLSQWRSAVERAGGLVVCDPLLRTVHQRCQGKRWPGNNGPYVCASELAEVIRFLSGRLVP
jgi:HEAT repeat protein